MVASEFCFENKLEALLCEPRFEAMREAVVSGEATQASFVLALHCQGQTQGQVLSLSTLSSKKQRNRCVPHRLVVNLLKR